MSVETRNVDYANVVTLRTIEGKSVADVAEKFNITWEEAREVIRNYGLVVKKDEKAPESVGKSYEIVYTNPEKVVVKKAKEAIGA